MHPIFLCLFIYLLVDQQIALVSSLECEKITSNDCIYNSTCSFVKEICNETNRKDKDVGTSRGGIFCSTLIEMKLDEELHLKHSGCMYDQEATKTCFNRSICQLKFTNKDHQYLHCCCDQSSCNIQFDLSNPTIEINDQTSTIDDNRNSCRLKRWWNNLFIRWSILFFMSLIFISVIVVMAIHSKRSDRRRFCSNLRRIFSMKTCEKNSSLNDEEKTKMIVDLDLNGHASNCEEKKMISFNVNEFQIESNPIKRGKFTEIYRSKYQRNTFILKLFKEYSSSNKNEQQRCSSFQNEQQIYSLQHFQHENLLKYFGSMERENNIYLILEYCLQGSLRDYLKVNFIANDDDLFNYCSQIAKGIEYLHRDFSQEKSNRRYPIAHRDIKSDNILLLNDQHLVLSDFAMSIHLDEKQLSSTDQQQQMGTPRYMSPEILAGTIGNELNSLLKSDVYSMSLVFWEILSRSKHLDPNQIYLLPFDEQLRAQGIDASPTIEQMLQIVHNEPPMNRPLIRSSWRKSPFIDEKLIRTIEQCWDSTPEGRITASLVAHRLKFSSNSNST